MAKTERLTICHIRDLPRGDEIVQAIQDGNDFTFGDNVFSLITIDDLDRAFGNDPDHEFFKAAHELVEKERALHNMRQADGAPGSGEGELYFNIG